MSKDTQDLNDIADMMRNLRAAISNKFAPSRERALAHTKLDECGLWLGAAELLAGTDKETEG